MASLVYVLGGLGATNHGQTSVNEPLRNIGGFGRRTNGESANRRQKGGDSSKMCLLTPKARGLHERLNESDAQCNHLLIQLSTMRNTWDQKKLEFSTLAT